MSAKKNILVLTFWSYKDALIQAYTLPYVNLIAEEIGAKDKIYLITQEQENRKMTIDELIQVKQRLRMQGIKLILLKYSKSDLRNMLGWIPNGIYLFFLVFFARIKYIHAWCATAGAVGYVLSKLTFKPLVVDSYEPHAEVMLETGTWDKKSPYYKMLFLLERLQGKHAKALITCTADMKDYCKRKFNIEIRNQWVKPACVNLEQFNLDKRKIPDILKGMKLEGKIVGVYAGKFGGLYLTQEVFDFIAVAHRYWGDKFRMLLLTSESDESLNAWKQKAQIPEGVVMKEFVPHEKVAYYMGLGDFGISPYNPVPSRKYSAPIKNSEYFALGLPVVITNNIADDSSLIEAHHLGAVIKELNDTEYLAAVKTIDKMISENSMEELYHKIRPYAEKLKNFSIAKKIYSDLYHVN